MDLRERIVAFQQRRDRAAILDDQALAEARHVRAGGPLAGSDHRVLGLFHYLRYVLSPYGRGADDLRLALESLVAAGSVPRPLCWLVEPDPEALTAFLDKRNAAHAQALTASVDRLDADLLDTAIDGLRQLAKCASEDAPIRFDVLSNFCVALWIRFERTGDLADLDEGAAAARDLTTAQRPGALANAALLLGARHAARYDRRDLDDQIAVLERALVVAATGDHDLARYGGDLADAVRIRFEIDSEVTDLDRAIDLYQQALEVAPAGHPDNAALLACMADCLSRRFRYSNDPGDLHGAVEAGRRALSVADRTGPAWSAIADRVGGTLIDRFTRLGVADDLDEGLGLQRMSIVDPVAAGSRLPTHLINYGHGLLRAFAWRGTPADLDTAIKVVRAASSRVPAASPEHPIAANVLSVALFQRFELRGRPEDLTDAISACRTAVTGLSERDPRRASYLSGLAVMLLRHFTRADAAPALDEAVAVAAEAVRLTALGDANRPRHLNNLGIALLERHDRDNTEADLDRAIVVLRDAVESESPHSPERAIYLTNLATSVRLRESAEQAMEYARAALAATAPGDVERCNRMLALSAVLADAGRRADAVVLLREAALRSTGPADHRMRAAIGWADMAGSDERLEALTTVIGLLPELAWHGLDRAVQEQRLRDRPLLVGQAAGHAVDAGRPGLAVELLEQGRTVIWSHLVRARTPLARIEAAHPVLAERLLTVRRLLDSGTGPGITDPVRPWAARAVVTG
ncbi:hypothetical protein [Actinoplanes xinjiangensis]|uniref:hypothetical protein n=1 Tax=Actinoplanes xinjiangensis TaxID=512350 RepID=UPI00344AE047